jgi:hypothetical protein
MSAELSGTVRILSSGRVAEEEEDEEEEEVAVSCRGEGEITLDGEIGAHHLTRQVQYIMDF